MDTGGRSNRGNIHLRARVYVRACHVSYVVYVSA